MHLPDAAPRASANALAGLITCGLLLFPLPSVANTSDWSAGVYIGQYYDTEPAGFVQGRAGFVDHYMLALTASKTVWRSATLPLSLEIDGMVGLQVGATRLGEVAIAPALRWSGFGWNDVVHTSVRAAPVGFSYTSSVSPLETGPSGQGSRALNWLFLELALSRPANPSSEFFMRLHHRCAAYDLLNNYGANGDDFFAVGFRRRF